MNATVFLVLSSLCLLTVQARRWPQFRITRTLTDTPCTSRYARSCGEYTLVDEESTTLTEGYGPNVCRTTKTYEVQTFLHVEANYCIRQRCWSACVSTQNCTGPMQNVTSSKVECCDGFAVAPVNNTGTQVAPFGSNLWRSLRRGISHGCTLKLRESVADCLLELDMDEFTLQLQSESPNTADELGNDDSSGSFTVFGLPNAQVNSSVATLGHIVNRTMEGKKLLDGRVLETLVPKVSLHIARGQQTKTVFVNGAEVAELNACQARNGIVHTMKSAIPQSDMTIAERLRGDSRFTSFLRLLDGANTTSLLDVTEGKSRTVFVPTNDAFSKLPDDAVECLLRPENSKSLSQLVLVHISFPAEYTTTLSQRSRLYTLTLCDYLSVQVEDDEILLTDSRIPLEESDIPANNGVIHVLPEVVVPPKVDFDELNCDTGDVITGA